jgi:hypothetical protein
MWQRYEDFRIVIWRDRVDEVWTINKEVESSWECEIDLSQNKSI